MKAEQKKEVEFVPVVITLESQLEVGVLAAISGRIVGDNTVREVASSLYYLIHSLSDNGNSDDFFSGELRAIKQP